MAMPLTFGDPKMASINEVEQEVRSMRDDLTEVKSDVKHVVRSVDTIMESVAKIHEWKDGDGERPGVNTRLDRLERFQAVILYVTASVATIVLGVVVVAVLKLLWSVPIPA